MQQTDKKPILFWMLVIGIFLIIFLFWLPSFTESVRTLTDSIGSKSNESAQDFEKNVAPQIDELKKTIDTLIKQLPVNAPEGAQPKEGAPPAVLPTEIPTLPDAPNESAPQVDGTKQESAGATSGPRQFCEKAGGIHQSRPGCTFCSGKTPVQPYDVCIFLDGSECEQKMFQKGECKKGQTQVAEDLIEIGVVPY